MCFRKIRELKNTLLFRLTLIYTLVFAVTTSLAFGFFYYRIYTVTMAGIDEELLSEIEQGAGKFRESGMAGIREVIADADEENDMAEEFIRFMNVRGDILSATNMASWCVISSHHLEELLDSESNHIRRTQAVAGRLHNARIVTAKIGPNMVMQIGENLADVEAYLDIFKGLFVTLSIILMVVSFVSGWFLASRSLMDMAEVTDTAVKISEGTLGRRVRVTGRFKEIERLGNAFNDMIARIQGLLKSMAEINDNIAHDLRTPLARIRGFAEMMVINKAAMVNHCDMAANIVEECDNLTEMINTMMDITETEAGVNEILLESFDLAGLARQAGDFFRPLAEEKHITYDLDIPDWLPFHGAPRKMQRVLSNLLENAIKYTPDHGRVSFAVNENGGVVQMVVADSGMGISATDLPHIFERFYRCDRSRSQTGNGLGLSLAKAYVESMNGAIAVESMENNGSTFVLTFNSYSHR